MPMDFYGNVTDDKGNFVENRYYESQSWLQAKSANDQLQAAAAAYNAVDPLQHDFAPSAAPSADAVATASAKLQGAYKNYAEATAGIGSNSPENFVDDDLTPSSYIRAEAPSLEFLPPLAGNMAGGPDNTGAVPDMSPWKLVTAGAALVLVWWIL